MPVKKIMLFFIYLAMAGMLAAQNHPAKLASIMKQYHNYNMFDGAVLVAENGNVIYKDAFGLANREWNIANKTDTKFMIGSVSKPLTAMLMLIQVQKGLVSLDKTIPYGAVLHLLAQICSLEKCGGVSVPTNAAKTEIAMPHTGTDRLTHRAVLHICASNLVHLHQHLKNFVLLIS